MFRVSGLGWLILVLASTRIRMNSNLLRRLQAVGL